MSTSKVISIVVFVLFVCYSVDSQNILLLERSAKYKNFKFYEGNQIHVKIKTDSSDLHVRGIINAIYDSSIIVNYNNIIMIKDIKMVYRPRLWAKLLSISALIAGTGYLALDAFNRAINHQYPVLDQQTVITSGIIIGAGLILIPFRERWYKIGEKWELKALVL